MSNTALRLTYYNIADGVCAFSTTRHGGTSEGNHASLNINPYCGDKLEHVAANRALLAEELGVDADRIILPHQTHGTETRIIGKEFCTLPEQIRQMQLEGVDARSQEGVEFARREIARHLHEEGGTREFSASGGAEIPLVAQDRLRDALRDVFTVGLGFLLRVGLGRGVGGRRLFGSGVGGILRLILGRILRRF